MRITIIWPVGKGRMVEAETGLADQRATSPGGFRIRVGVTPGTYGQRKNVQDATRPAR
jgi:hypothetical protein